MNNLLPNFLIVGAAKSGTTSLFHYLTKHPDVFIPSRKEGRFFSQMPGNFKGPGAKPQNDIIVSINDYKKLFLPGKNAAARGDISNDYLFYYKKSISNIKKHLNEEVKIIIILRNPMDRAYSNYLQHVREGWENISFEEALKAEYNRKKNNWAWPFLYKEVSLWSRPVKAFLSNFKNVYVFLFEDLFNIQRILHQIYTILGVSDCFKPDTSRKYNISGVPKAKLLHNMYINAAKLKPLFMPLLGLLFSPEKLQYKMSKLKARNLRKTSIKPETYQYLKEYFRKDIEDLNNLIDRNVKSWLE